MAGRGERITFEIEPQAVFVTAGLHYQRIALSMSYRVAFEAGEGIFRKRPVQKNLAELHHVFTQDGYCICGLDDLLRKEVGPMANG